MTKSNVPRPGGDKTFRIMTMISIGSYKSWFIWMSTVTVWSMDTSPDLCKDILSTNGHPSMGFSPHKGLASCSGGKLSWGGIPLYLSRRSARYISCVVLWTLLPQVHYDVMHVWCRCDPGAQQGENLSVNGNCWHIINYVVSSNLFGRKIWSYDL